MHVKNNSSYILLTRSVATGQTYLLNPKDVVAVKQFFN